MKWEDMEDMDCMECMSCDDVGGFVSTYCEEAKECFDCFFVHQHCLKPRHVHFEYFFTLLLVTEPAPVLEQNQDLREKQSSKTNCVSLVRRTLKQALRGA